LNQAPWLYFTGFPERTRCYEVRFKQRDGDAMSGPESRIEARDNFDPHKAGREAREELGRIQATIRSAKESIARGVEAIRRSQALISRIPDKW
jgi:hypothetical protein